MRLQERERERLRGRAGRQSSEIGLRVFWGMSREREEGTMKREGRG